MADSQLGLNVLLYYGVPRNTENHSTVNFRRIPVPVLRILIVTQRMGQSRSKSLGLCETPSRYALLLNDIFNLGQLLDQP